jgi:hypothetical protein
MMCGGRGMYTSLCGCTWLSKATSQLEGTYMLIGMPTKKQLQKTGLYLLKKLNIYLLCSPAIPFWGVLGIELRDLCIPSTFCTMS